MKSVIFAYKDKELGCTFELKTAANSKEDIATSVKRLLVKCELKDVNNYVGKAVVVLGEYDDESGITACGPEQIVDCDEILIKKFPEIYEQKSNQS